MISINSVKYLKQISELQVDLIPGGAIYLIIEGDKFVWRKASKVFDLDIFQVGEKLNANSISGKAIKENKTISINVPRSLYGMRLRMIAEPIVNEEGQAIGAFSIVFPRLHPVAKSFGDFAPILAEMFPEGAFLYMTDLKKIAYRQPSRKFDVPNLQVKDIISEDLIASKVIKTKEPITMELDSSKYGIPVLVTCYPLFDEDNSEEVVATLGVVIPKVIAGNLRDMSHNLEIGLEGIVAAIEQLSTSAFTIHENEQELNNEIEEIIRLSEQIDEVSAFIKKISDETNMLGLNAAIEAARAGQSGMGFSVVAKQIRKLSEQSKNTVPKIRILTDSIKAKVGKTSDKSQSSLVSSQEQAATTEEITASVEEIAAMSEELSKIAQQM